MKFIADINVMPKQGLLDPQGKAVSSSLHNLGLSRINDVRVGKHLTLSVDAPDEASALAMANDACNKLLANLVMEEFTVAVRLQH